MLSADLEAIHISAHPNVVDSTVMNWSFTTRQFCVFIVQR